MGREDRDRQRYEQWVERHGAELYRFAQRLCGQKEQAEDLVQETFYHAWRSMGSLREEDRARAWLFRILRHRYAHQARTATRRPRANTPLESAPERPDAEAFTPLEDMARGESLQLALDGLEERYRLPLLMVFMEGLTCRETAEQLEIPLGTVELPPSERARETGGVGCCLHLNPEGARPWGTSTTASSSSGTR